VSPTNFTKADLGLELAKLVSVSLLYIQTAAWVLKAPRLTGAGKERRGRLSSGPQCVLYGLRGHSRASCSHGEFGSLMPFLLFRIRMHLLSSPVNAVYVTSIGVSRARPGRGAATTAARERLPARGAASARGCHPADTRERGS
jgi:hypothetical protein